MARPDLAHLRCKTMFIQKQKLSRYYRYYIDQTIPFVIHSKAIYHYDWLFEQHTHFYVQATKRLTQPRKIMILNTLVYNE